MLMHSHGTVRHKRGLVRILIKALTPALLGTSMLTGIVGSALAAEPWFMVERTFWEDADPARGQGVTTDGTYWYFSGTHSLEITDAAYNTILIDSNAILSQVGLADGYTDVTLNHIGDIDYANGKLYISLDATQRDPITNNKYSNPVFAVYDAATLTWTGEAYALNPPHGIHDIASWVAVDAANGLAYGIAYDNATELTVYNLADFSFKEYLPLSQVVDQAQGGKILNGYMYFATDNDEKLLMRANLSTGEVEVIGNLKIDGEQEVEGLSIKWTGDGWSMNVLNREESTPGSGIEGVGFYKYLRPVGNSLSGEIHADISGALVSDTAFMRETTGRRLRGVLDGGISATEGTALWGELVRASGSTDSAGDAAAFEHSAAGFVGGAEGQLGDWLVGFGAGYRRSDFDVSDRASTGTADTFELGVYGGTRMGDFGLTLGATWAGSDIDTKRSVVFPAINERLSASYGASTMQAYGELDYRLAVGTTTVSPFAGLALVSSHTDAFTETGGDIAALGGDENTTQNAVTTIGARVAAPVNFGEMAGNIHGQIGWQHALQPVDAAVSMTTRSGDSFDSVGVPIAKDALNLEAGLDLSLSDNSKVSLNYSGQLASGGNSQALKVAFDMKF
jgi:subtilase-type serine protease